MNTSTAETPFARSIERARGEFLEMPGLCLTERQAQRLWNLELPLCRALLESLRHTRFLRRTNDGVYMRTGTH